MDFMKTEIQALVDVAVKGIVTISHETVCIVLGNSCW